MRGESKLLWAFFVIIVLVIVFMCGMVSVTKGFIQKAWENPRQYYELKPIHDNSYMDDVERIRRENGINNS